MDPKPAVRGGVAIEQLALLPPATLRDQLDNPDWLRHMYARHDVHHIARVCGCSPATVLARMDRHGIRRRKAGQQPVVSITFHEDPGFISEVNQRVEADLARGEVGEGVLAVRVRAAVDARRAGDRDAFRSALADIAAASMALAGIA